MNIGNLRDLIIGDAQADRAVPPTGFTARLTIFAAGAMAFLVVFALALTLAAGRVADRWANDLADNVTLRLANSQSSETALNILQTTPGINSARALSPDEQRALLAPFLGSDLPIEDLPVPQLIEIDTDENYDADGLTARLTAELPGAVLDDHTAWRDPLIAAAGRLRFLAWVSILLIGITTAAMITLAAQASLSANGQVIRVLRLVGARDIYIARAFVRRFTLRAGLGAIAGTILGGFGILLLPGENSIFATGLRLQGAQCLLLILIPPLAAIVAFVATRAAALRRLREQT